MITDQPIRKDVVSMMDLVKAYDFSDQVVVVTGGTGVLLSPTVKKLIELNAQVVLLSRTYPEHLMQALSQIGSQPMFLSVDVSKKDQILDASQQILARFGKVDILINGAGGNQLGATTNEEQSFFDLSPAVVGEVFDVNFMGTFFACQVFGKAMASRGSGIILNISSLAGLNPLTRVVSYSAAKAGVNNLTRWLAVHMAQKYSTNIRINAIAPGFLLTEQNRYLLTDESGELTQRGLDIINATPMHRFGQPEDMIGTILWLICEASKFVTGVVVPVDGGFSAFGGI